MSGASQSLRRAGRWSYGALAVVSCGCLLRDPALIVDAGAKSDVGRVSAGRSADPAEPDAGEDTATAKAANEISASGGSSGGASARPPNKTSASGGSSGGAAAAGRGGSDPTKTSSAGAPADVDVCGQSVCAEEYPCQKLDSGYTCRGQFADWSPTYSASRFSVSEGTVKDSQSKLVWQQTLPSTWAPACSGEQGADASAADGCTWEDAKKYCAGLTLAGGHWRLPTKAELESLVDDSRAKPAIDPTAFPGTPTNYFWTSSVHAGSDRAWSVGFFAGASYDFAKKEAIMVRCVR